MKHFILLILFGFFIVINADVKVEEKQTLNEYKIEQQQKSIDELKAEIKELKKEIDDTKEKKIGNEKDNESLDKRIGDINGSVDRFGILITVLFIVFGISTYFKAKADAKNEAEKVTKDWIENEGNKKLEPIIKKFEDEIKQQSEAEDLFLQGRSYYFNKEYEKAEEYYNKALEAGHIGALNNLGALYYHQSNYEKAEEYYIKALESGDNRALNNLGVLYNKQKEYEKAEEYYKKAINAGNNEALRNLGVLYQEQKEYSKAEEYYKKAIGIGDNNALTNLRILYTEQNEQTKLEELKQKYKI